MSRSNNQDDTIVPWDDFSSTQLERAEQFAVRKHELSVVRKLFFSLVYLLKIY